MGKFNGDLIADVAVAKIDLPAMAMAGCFFGFGTALFIQTSNVHPNAYERHFHVGIVIKFVFLLLSLIGSLLGITWCRFQVPRFWRFCRVGLYILFTTGLWFDKDSSLWMLPSMNVNLASSLNKRGISTLQQLFDLPKATVQTVIGNFPASRLYQVWSAL
ncbi:cation exchanger 11 [Fagus crenata]